MRTVDTRQCGSQELHEPGAASQAAHYVAQSVVLFPSAHDAAAFFTASAQHWPACSNRRFNVTFPGDPDEVWTVGPVSNTNGTLSTPYSQEGANGWTCQRVLTMANNGAIDIKTCSYNQSDPAAVNIAHQVAANVPTTWGWPAGDSNGGPSPVEPDERGDTTTGSRAESAICSPSTGPHELVQVRQRFSGSTQRRCAAAHLNLTSEIPRAVTLLLSVRDLQPPTGALGDDHGRGAGLRDGDVGGHRIRPFGTPDATRRFNETPAVVRADPGPRIAPKNLCLG